MVTKAFNFLMVDFMIRVEFYLVDILIESRFMIRFFDGRDLLSRDFHRALFVRPYENLDSTLTMIKP